MSVSRFVFVLFKVKILLLHSLLCWLKEIDSTGTAVGVRVLKKSDDNRHRGSFSQLSKMEAVQDRDGRLLKWYCALRTNREGAMCIL